MSGNLRGPRPDRVWVDEPAPVVDEVGVYRAWANAWPGLRVGLGLRPNICVHAAIGAARAARRLGIDAEPRACRTVVVSPSSGRMAEYGRTPGVEYVADLSKLAPTDGGYAHHAVVVGPEGFVDLTLTSHQLVGQAPALDWSDDAVSLDPDVVPFLRGFAPDAETGDAWAAGGVAPPGAFPGADEPILAAWELIDVELAVKLDNVPTVDAIAEALYRVVAR